MDRYSKKYHTAMIARSITEIVSSITGKWKFNQDKKWITSHTTSIGDE